MFTFSRKVIKDIDLNSDEIFLHLFKTEWQKTIVDEGNHNYDGFVDPLKTNDGRIFNKANYSFREHTLINLDIQMTKILGGYCQSHFVNILPKCNIGIHRDIYDSEDETLDVEDSDKINTSILFPVFGNIDIWTEKNSIRLFNDVFTVVKTDELNDGINVSKSLAWCTNTLVYNMSYDEVKEKISDYIIEDFD